MHDATHKAGVALLKFLKSGGTAKGDIQKKDGRDEKDFDAEEEDKGGDSEEETQESKN